MKQYHCCKMLLIAMMTVAVPAMAQQSGEVDRLLAMSPADRNAELKSMPPEERRGLWFAVKREQASRRGAESPVGSYRGASSNGSEPARKASTNRNGGKAVGTIAYDDNVTTSTFGGGAIIGNRFNTHTGIPVFASGQVNTVQAVVAQGSGFTTSSAGFVVLGPQTTGGGAMAIFSTFTGAATGTSDTVTFTGFAASYTGSSFFVLFGDFASGYVPAFGTGSTNGQGHHGVVGYTGGMGPNITGTFDFGGALNGLVRATGNIVPVELMQFSVD